MQKMSFRKSLLNETSHFLAVKQYLIFGKVYIFNHHLNIA